MNNIIAELDDILEGCHSIIDAHQFRVKYKKKYPEYETLIDSIIDGFDFFDNVDIISKQEILKDIICISEKDKIFDILDNTIKRTNDDILINCIENIIPTKGYKKKKHIIDNNEITKQCPHCNHSISSNKDTKYIICGYHDTNNGYDHKGCGNDWCFKCNKKLCKNWIDDKLNSEINRLHDIDCCEKKAVKNNEDYKNNYCQCNNYDINIYDMFLNDK